MLTGAYAELANQVRIWSRQLRELNMLAGRMELGKYNKAYARMLVLRSQSELHSFASMGGSESKPDKREVERLSGKAIAEMAQTLNFVEAAAQEKLALAKQGICEPGAKRDATRVQKEIDKMDDQYDEIDSAMGKIMKLSKVEVKMSEPISSLHLQQKNTVEFIITGPAEDCTGLVIWHVEGTGGHEKGIDTNEKDFEKLVGSFDLDRATVNNLRENYHAIMFQIPESGKEIRVKFIFKELAGKFLFIAATGKNITDLELNLGNIKINDPIKRGSFEVKAIYQQDLFSASDFKDKGRFSYEGKRYNDGNIVYYQGRDEHEIHPNEYSHFCQLELLEKICEVEDRFARQYPGGQIWINDMSLPWGGTFRTGNKASSSGHNSHKTGRQVDISFRNMTSVDPGNPVVEKMQRIDLDIIIRSVFGNANVLFHSAPIYWHWHCSLDSAGGTGKPIMDIFVEYYRSGKHRKEFTDFLKDYGFFEEIMRIINLIKKSYLSNC